MLFRSVVSRRKFIGAKLGTEDVNFLSNQGVVEEHSLQRRSRVVRRGGAERRENVGMSSKKAGKNPAHRKPKVSWATQIDPGLVDPKAHPV